MQQLFRSSVLLTIYYHLLVTTTTTHADTTIVSEQRRFSPLPPTVFAPSGRLHMVERVAQETTDSQDTTSSLVIAIKCEGGEKLVLVCSSPVSPYCIHDLLDNDEHEHEDNTRQEEETSTTTSTTTTSTFYNKPLLLLTRHNKTTTTIKSKPHHPTISTIGTSLILATAGNAMEATVLHRKLQQIVLSMIRHEQCSSSSHDIDPAIVARKIADVIQLTTQTVADEDHPRMLAVRMYVLGYLLSYLLIYLYLLICCCCCCSR